ncbi:uncharacterized protein [Panulirus ornatus]|uniref:uncharacterized protein isoform X2 n=1 Tax=Panulirus ornatus TaxID=150431 RepID=UPI003A8AADCE
MSVNLGNDTKAASPVRTPDEGKESKYEPKQNKKIIRLLTVIAYVISVSMAAIILSLYYVFLWNPEMKYSPKHKQGAFTNKNEFTYDDNSPALISQPFSSHDELRASDDIDRQPTPRVLPLVKESFEVAAPAAHLTPTHPIPGDDPSTAQGDSPVGQPSKHYPLMSFSTHQQQQHQQDQYHQQQRQIQQQQQQQLEPLIALA